MKFNKEGVVTKKSPEFAMLTSRQERINQLKEITRFFQIELDNLQSSMKNEEPIRKDLIYEYLKHKEDLFL